MKVENASDDLAAAERGFDHGSLGRSTLVTGEEVTVNTMVKGNDLVVTPVRVDLHETAQGLAMSQILEEDFTAAIHENRIVESSRRGPRESLIWYGIRPSAHAAVTGDRVLIRQDTLESEHSCRACQGKGHTDVICTPCEGKQTGCKFCLVLGFDRETQYSSGHEKCRDCRGTGWKSGIVIPEIAQSKPVTGIVVSLGPESRLSKLGDRVLHSRFAGHSLTTPEGETYTVMREPEILMLLQDVNYATQKG